LAITLIKFRRDDKWNKVILSNINDLGQE